MIYTISTINCGCGFRKKSTELVTWEHNFCQLSRIKKLGLLVGGVLIIRKTHFTFRDTFDHPIFTHGFITNFWGNRFVAYSFTYKLYTMVLAQFLTNLE